MRGPLEGIWLKDLRGWKMTFRDVAGSVLFVLTHDAPGRVLAPITCALDALGTLERLEFDWKGRFPYAPSSLTCRLELLDATHGWQEVAEGWLEQPGSRRLRSRPRFVNFYRLVENDFYRGNLPPGMDELGIVGLNFSGAAKPPETADNYTQTVSGALSEALRGSPDASVGTDANRRMLLARPGQGSPVRVSATRLLAWDIGDYEAPPYYTDWRASPGRGWAGFEGGNPRGPLVPQKARGAGVKFEEVKTAQGMPLLGAFTAWVTPKPPPPIPTPPDWEPLPDFQDAGWVPSSNLAFEHVGQGQGVLLVYDPQTWYGHSSLVETNASDYEPMSAYLRVGVTLLELPPLQYSGDGPDYAVVLDESIWASSLLTPDPDAVGLPGGPGLDPSPVHPQESEATQGKPFRQAPRARLYREDIGKVNYLDYPIPDEMFRQDKREDFGPRWALHIALSYLLERTGGVPEGAEATVRFEFVKVEFGKKTSAPDDTEEGQNLPYTEGPSCNGEARGALIGPVLLDDLEIVEGTLSTQAAVSFDITLDGPRSSTRIVTGVLPWR